MKKSFKIILAFSFFSLGSLGLYYFFSGDTTILGPEYHQYLLGVSVVFFILAFFYFYNVIAFKNKKPSADKSKEPGSASPKISPRYARQPEYQKEEHPALPWIKGFLILGFIALVCSVIHFNS